MLMRILRAVWDFFAEWGEYRARIALNRGYYHLY